MKNVGINLNKGSDTLSIAIVYNTILCRIKYKIRLYTSKLTWCEVSYGGYEKVEASRRNIKER